MDCSTPGGLIACAIRDSSDPNVFQYFAYLIVPAFLGLVTLAVAVASWRVAKASYVLSRALVDENKRAQQAGRKLAIADQAFLWGAGRWTDEVPSVKEKSRRHAEMGRLSIALTQSGLPGAGELQDFLWDLDAAKVDASLSSVGKSVANSYLGGAFAAMTETAIIEWIRRPNALKPVFAALRTKIPDVLATANSSARDFLNDTDQEGPRGPQAIGESAVSEDGGSPEDM